MSEKRFHYDWKTGRMKDTQSNSQATSNMRVLETIINDACYSYEEKIKELEREKQDLKDKAKILVEYYSRRYVNAIFNNEKHSKQFKSDLWIVKEVLCNLDLYDDGDVE